MGQQQLLLLVLSTVIVGLATVAGIQAFEQGSVRANQDALTNTAVKIASDIQAHIKEPSQFGGYDGDMSSANGNITLDEMGYETNGSNEYETADGHCFIETGASSGSSFDNSTTPSLTASSPDFLVGCESDENSVAAKITGLDSEDIESEGVVAN